MLVEQGGDDIILQLISHEDTKATVVRFCGLILATLSENAFLTLAMQVKLRNANVTIPPLPADDEANPDQVGEGAAGPGAEKRAEL